MGLLPDSHMLLLRSAGFTSLPGRELAEGAFGPPVPPAWRWRPPHLARPQGRGPQREDKKPEHKGGKPGGRKPEGAKSPERRAEPPRAAAVNANSAFAALAGLLKT